VRVQARHVQASTGQAATIGPTWRAAPIIPVVVRLVFLGSPAFAVPSLSALLDAGHEIALVVSQPDRPAGRGRSATPTAVAAFAQAQGLPLWQTSSVRGPQAESRLRDEKPEAMALAAFAALIPNNVLAIAPILNVHPSLLPRWRGAAPIQAALLAGDTETGVTIIQLVQALDAGPMLLQERMSIAAEDDYLTLEPRLAQVGARLLVQALETKPEPRPQDDSLATFCQRIDREDARIDWTQPVESIWRQVRAYRGWPQAFTGWDGKQLKILRAWPLSRSDPFPFSDTPETPGTVVLGGAEPRARRDLVPLVVSGAGLLRIDEVQLEGKRAQSAGEFLRGYPKLIGAKLGMA
jgi:methionyl-tRNA formyltransferase